MDNYTADRVINGTFGEVWVDNDYMAEVIGLEAKIKLDTSDVNMTRTLEKGTKVTGISGSGTLKLNKVSSYFINKIAANLKEKLDTSDVNMTRTLEKGTKVTGISGSGTLKLNKVSSYFINKIAANLKEGKATRATIISKLEDPEALGAERIALNNCVFTELTLADWEAAKLGEESIPFTFSSFDILESITA